MGQSAAGFGGSGQVECSRQLGHAPHGNHGKSLAQGGVDIINDVAALSDEGAVALLAQQSKTGVCLMHMQGFA